MKINPYKGIYHSYAERAWRGVDLLVSVAVTPEYNNTPDLSLVYNTADGKKTLKMNECTVCGNAHIFSATISGTDLNGISILDYCINDGIFTVFSCEVKVCDVPSLPPVIITEVYGRPKRGKVTSRYVELTNISDEPVDLYDLRITKTLEGKSVSSYLASFDSQKFIHSGETVVIRFLVKESFDTDGDIAESHEEYLKGIYDENLYEKLEYREAKVFDVDCTRVNPESGKRENDPAAFALGPDQKPTIVTLSGRNEGDEKYRFEIVLNRDPHTIDVLNSRAALFSVDITNPHVGRHIRRNIDPTPGILDTRVPVPDFKNDKAPLIVLSAPLSAHLSADGEMKIKYNVVGNAELTYAVLYLPDGEKTIYAEDEQDGGFSVTVPVAIIRSVKELKCSIVADNGAYVSRYGDVTDPVAFRITDNSGPAVNMLSPKPDFCFSGETTPTISAEFSDISGVNIPACRILLDGKDVTDCVLWQGTRFTYKPSKALKLGEHKLKLTAYDLLGNTSVSSVKFSIAPYEQMNCYFGEVHTHTAESDGTGTPLEAMLYARDVAGMDYFSVTEHSNYLIDDKYENQIKIANSLNSPGKFAALYGWEMTWNHSNGLWGHMNVIGCKNVVRDKDNYSLGMFYDWLDKNGGIAMFNHPGYPWGNFDEYAIPAEIANRNAALAEIKSNVYDREYAHMLKRGYRVAPVYNEDNHSNNWGTANDCMGCVLAPYLSRENVLDAFRKRRTYSTSDKTLRMKYSINGMWLGSELEDPEELNVKVEISTELDSGIGRVQLVAVNGIVVAEINVGLRQSYTWELILPPEYPFYYVRIVGAGKYTVSSPVWIKGNGGIGIEELSVPSSFTEELPAVVKFSLRNNTEDVLKDVRTDIYLSPTSGMNTSDLPYITVYCGKLKAGERVNVSRKLPVVSGNRALTVIASGEGKKHRVCDSDTVILSQLLVAEVVPLTSPCIAKNPEGEEYTVTNPFPYVKLYNTSCRDISLDGTSVRLWNKAGKVPAESQILPLTGLTLKADSVLVIWKRKDENLTVDDFNARYGTALVEGTDIIATKVAVCASDAGSKRVDLLRKNEVISRVTYNYCLENLGNEIEIDKAFNYVYVPNFTVSSRKLDDLTCPNPSAVYDEQKPVSIIGGPKTRELKAEKKAVKQEEKRKKDAEKPGFKLPVVGGVAAAGAAAGAVVGSVLKATKKVSPSAQAKADAKLIAKTNAKAQKKADAAETKIRKASEKRMVKAISAQIDKTLDKKYQNKAVGSIDARIKNDKENIKQAKKNMKVLKMQKKAEKATAKREAEIRKAQDS